MAAPTAPVMAFNGKAYRNTGSYGSPTWTLIDNVGDIEITDSMTKSPLSLRMAGGLKFNLPGEREINIAFKMLYNPADTNMTALRTAYLARTTVDIVLLDQAVATAGSSGQRAVCALYKAHRTEAPIGDAMMFDVEMGPTYSTDLPSDFTAAGS